MYIEGKNVVLEALKGGETINQIFVQNGLFDASSKEIVKTARESGIKMSFVDKAVLDKKSKNKKHQGFIADVIEFEYCDVEDILALSDEKHELPFILILDGIKDPHNFGSIIRSAECAGVHGIIIPKHRSVAVNETVVKVSEGAISNIKIAKVVNINQCIEQLQKQGVWVYALEAQGKNIYQSNLKGPIALVVGSEGEGVSKLTLQKSDDILAMPLKGKVNSLNAATAAAVAIYEVVRQRG